MTSRPFRAAAVLAFLALPLRAADVPIHDVQGAGAESPRAGQTVTTTGIVTGVKSNGFFLQAPDAEADADPATAEGVFVFTSSTPPSAAVVGNRVRVTGSVVEYRPSADPTSPPLTEIGSPSVSFLSSGNALPAPVALGAADLSPASALDRLERYEGMRVRVETLVVVAPTDGTVDEGTATARSNGLLWGVLPGVARPFREAGADPGVPLPAGSPCCVPRNDGNPERLRVDTDGLVGALPLDVAAGTTLSGLVGPLDFGARAYTLLPEKAPVPSGGAGARAVPAPQPGEATIGFLNLERFFDDTPSGVGPTLNPDAWEMRLKKASAVVRAFLGAPDVLAVAEVESLPVLTALAARVGADAVAAGEADPGYRAYLEEGNDASGIDVGFLVAARVRVGSVAQEGKSATYTDPVTGSAATLNDRPPLVLSARGAAPDGTEWPFTVVVNHLRSLLDVEADSSAGRRARAKRQAQAEYLAGVLSRLQAAGPDVPILAVGDFNAYDASDGLVDVIGTARGAPAPANEVAVERSVDLLDPDFLDLGAIDGFLAPSERYSYTFAGNAQLIDHALASRAAAARVCGLAMARVGADFPEAWRGDAARPERLTDHDGLVVRLRLGPGAGRSPEAPLPGAEAPLPYRSRTPEVKP